MPVPELLLNALKNAKGFDKEAFEKVHVPGEQVTSIRLNPLKPFALADINVGSSPVPWSEYGYYLDERPSFTFDPLFHAGCYYVQEASSMFLEQAIRQCCDLSKPLRALDLCAAPGGKSTHIQSLLSKESLLVSNDVIRARANILKENIIKWGTENVVVTNNDPRDFSKLENYFDLIVVDAPCSGSGLFRRDPDAIAEWSLNNVTLCSQRQQRILADIWPALKPNGVLVYSTCSYSKEEDEEIVDWLVNEMKAENIPLSVPGEWGIIASDGGYRFWPDKIKGEGFFLACFRKTQDGEAVKLKTKTKADAAGKNDEKIIEKWVDTTGLEFIKYQQTVYGWPTHLANEYNWLLNNLRVIYSGTIIGEMMREKLVPDHALAMSPLAKSSIGKIELTYEQAIAYLRRADLEIDTSLKGWQLVAYKGHPLGWVNLLTNRLNNYYPKELRILKTK